MGARALHGRLPLLALAAVIGLLHIATLREGHDWSGDNAAYILHARNLLEGRSYHDIGLIPNPVALQDAYYIPPAYPPMLPALIAPLHAIWGDALAPMKTLLVVCFAAGLYGLGRLAQRRVGPAGALATVAIVGASPAMWRFKEFVVSEFVFFALVCGVVAFVEARGFAPGGERDRNSAVRLGALVGLGVFACYATRSVALLLLPALLLAELVATRRLPLLALTAAAVCAPLALAQNALLHTATGHLSYKLLFLSPELVWHNLTQTYPDIWVSFWGTPWVGVPAFVLALWGAAQTVRERGVGLLEIFGAIYFAFFVAIRFDDVRPLERYLVPALPIAALLAVRGALALPIPGATARRAAAAAGALAVAASFGRVYSQATLEPIRWGSTGPQAQRVYEFIRSNTAPDEPVLMWEPRVLTLYTGRPSGHLATHWSAEQRRDYARRIGARYWVFPRDVPDEYAEVVELVFETRLLRVYRFRD